MFLVLDFSTLTLIINIEPPNQDQDQSHFTSQERSKPTAPPAEWTPAARFLDLDQVLLRCEACQYCPVDNN
eukprot:1037746-Pelagomonas_calceolata.AAC.2